MSIRHFPSIEAIASELSIHPRTLRRRLEAESITDVVAELGMKLAVEYLRKTRMTNEKIAARLDYSDAANFRHAFARWTGTSPSASRGENARDDLGGRWQVAVGRKLVAKCRKAPGDVPN